MFDVAFTTGGVILVVLVWLSVLHTTLVPTRSSRMAAWTARGCVLTGSIAVRALPPRYRKRVMDLCMPVSLFVMAAGWLAGLALGFALLVGAFGWTSGTLQVNGVVIALIGTALASAMLVAA
ncbi:MAG TPA: hypothetical protein VFT95_17490, partial [Micromonosporaceae bacterium]|nr:hypothetical protein [Micromonosporaceae bacterium]